MRKFNTGATRDTDEGKLKIEGFIDPLVDQRYSQYMHVHRKQADGELRSPDNWQKGIDRDAYADSMIRHVLDFRLHYDGYPDLAVEHDIECVLCAIMFNVRGYLFEILKEKRAKGANEKQLHLFDRISEKSACAEIGSGIAKVGV